MWTSPRSKQAREALRKANDLLRLAVVVRDAHDAITVQDLEGRILAWNPGAVRMYGWSEAEALAMNVRDRIPEELREEALAKIRQLSRAEVLRAVSYPTDLESKRQRQRIKISASSRSTLRARMAKLNIEKP